MRFYLDEHLSDEVADIARNLGVDVTTVHECQTDGEPDEVQLTHATERNRCIVTRDRDDFTLLATTWVERARDHTGILIVSRSLPGGNPAAIAHALAHYHRGHPNDVYLNLFDWLHPAPQDNSS